MPRVAGVVSGVMTMDCDEIDDIVEDAYRMVAPKRLIALLDDDAGSTPD